MELPIYNQEGTQTGTFALPKVFASPWNPNLVYQVVTSEMANRRPVVAHAKGRGEVRGGGRKPWRQKGTGRARHGSIRSPIWKGGGVAHGPKRERQFDRKINRKMAKRALAVVLSAKARERELLVLDTLTFAEAKTKLAAATFRKLAAASGHADLIRGTRRALLVVSTRDVSVMRASRNLPFIEVIEARNMTALDAMHRKYLVMPRDAIESLVTRLSRS